MHPFVRAVVDGAAAQHLFPPDARVLVALSGGPDSCALLLALCEAADHGALPRPTLAAHFHHGLRGADADTDAAFSVALAARLGLVGVIGLGSVTASGQSPNAAARRARYAFLEAAARDGNANLVATAHTIDDQSETVLGRVLRGTSADGLAGIPVGRTLAPDLAVVRPLLDQTRAAIEAYCRDKNVAPRRDPSNNAPRYARARLRALLPDLAARFNPRLNEALSRLARSAAIDADFFAPLADALWERVALLGPRRAHLCATLAGEHAALRRRVLLRALRHAAGDDEAASDAAVAAAVVLVDALLRSGSGQTDLPGGVRARADARGITLASRRAAALVGAPRNAVLASYRVPLPAPPCRAWIGPAALWLRVEAAGTAEHWDNEHTVMRRPRSVRLAMHGTMGPGGEASGLVVRSPRLGDRIAPLGMGGKTRLVRDCLAELGWPEPARAWAPLVTRRGADDTVLWIVGGCQAEETRVSPDTPFVFRLTAEPDC